MQATFKLGNSWAWITLGERCRKWASGQGGDEEGASFPRPLPPSFSETPRVEESTTVDLQDGAVLPAEVLDSSLRSE